MTLAFVGLFAASSRADVATDCTLFASSRGNDANAGTSADAPKTLRGASAVSRPGSVICLVAGTYSLSTPFRPARSGTAENWIVYKAYGDGAATIVWTGQGSDNDLFAFTGTIPWNGRNYIEVRGLTFDGQNTASNALKCRLSHHLRFVDNTISYTGGGGISSVLCDYLTADSNRVYRSGYNQGWSSGISFNSNQWSDGYRGFHNIVINNLVSGSFDASSNKTDGNGIIMDLSNRTYDAASANTPPALVANNVVYQNGGRCIETYVVTNVWVINNTCYKNTLDLSQPSGEIATNKSRDIHFVNNIAASWNNRQPFSQYNTNQNIVYYRNISYGGRDGLTYSSPSEFIREDPLFASPPVLDPTRDGQYRMAIPPEQLAGGLMIRSGSPAIDRGIDPTTIPGVGPEIAEDMRRFLFTDQAGNPRPTGSAFDLGAYEYRDPPLAPWGPATPSTLGSRLLQWGHSLAEKLGLVSPGSARMTPTMER